MFDVASIHRPEVCHSPRAVEFAVKSVLICMTKSGMWYNCTKAVASAALGKCEGCGLT